MTQEKHTAACTEARRSKIVEAVAAIAEQAKAVGDCPASKRGDYCEYCERDAAEVVSRMKTILQAHESAQQEKPHTGTVADFDDAHLLRRAILNARGTGRGKKPRWVAVMRAFNLGSTYASQLCKRFEINPDEMVTP